MKRKLSTVFFIGLFLAGVTGIAHSNSINVIYNNGLPDQVQGLEMTHWVAADDFILPNDSLFSDGHFGTLGYSFSTWDGTLDYYIFADNSGQPGATLYSGSGRNVTKTATGISFNDATEYSYEFDTETAHYLYANSTYWFGLHLAADFTAAGYILWETTGTGFGSFVQLSEHGTFDNWTKYDYETAFYLTGKPIPEPATMLLLGTGLVGVAGAARRRKINQA